MNQAQLSPAYTRPKGQLLKWIGNKFKYANQITSLLPKSYNKFIEPFVGTGAILATVAPEKAIAGDTLSPLIELWQLMQEDRQKVVAYYANNIEKFNGNRKKCYDKFISRYNANPNGLDLLLISRTCYGGVLRFTREGTISTPIGPHKPISPETFKKRVEEWYPRIEKCKFYNKSFEYTMSKAKDGDVIYCDPPYVDSQSILYGAQKFEFYSLVDKIAECKARGAKVALSIDGKKKSGKKKIELSFPDGLFAREIFLDCGSSMLRRFQKKGKIMLGEDVHDRLLLTW